jgi:hypothetical protein
MEQTIHKITPKDLEKILGFNINETLKNKIEKFDLKYRPLTYEERNDYILNVINVLTNDIIKSGEHRISEWENALCH